MAVAPLPKAEAILYITLRDYTHKIVKVDQIGNILEEPHHVNEYNESCYRSLGTGLLILGGKLYATQYKSNSLIEIELSTLDLLNVYQIPGASNLVNYGQLHSDPRQIQDKELILADVDQRHIFTYNVSTGHKKVRIRNVRNPRGVSYINVKKDTFYLVCDIPIVEVYNSMWKFVRYIGKAGKGELSFPISAIMIPEENILIADQDKKGVWKFTFKGYFIENLQTGHYNFSFISALAFLYPNIWILHDDNQVTMLNMYNLIPVKS